MTTTSWITQIKPTCIPPTSQESVTSRQRHSVCQAARECCRTYLPKGASPVKVLPRGWTSDSGKRTTETDRGRAGRKSRSTAERQAPPVGETPFGKFSQSSTRLSSNGPFAHSAALRRYHLQFHIVRSHIYKASKLSITSSKL